MAVRRLGHRQDRDRAGASLCPAVRTERRQRAGEAGHRLATRVRVTTGLSFTCWNGSSRTGRRISRVDHRERRLSAATHKVVFAGFLLGTLPFGACGSFTATQRLRADAVNRCGRRRPASLITLGDEYLGLEFVDERRTSGDRSGRPAPCPHKPAGTGPPFSGTPWPRHLEAIGRRRAGRRDRRGCRGPSSRIS